MRRLMIVGILLTLMLGLAAHAWAQQGGQAREILGGLVWFAAVVIGLGALALAIWRARSASQATAATQA